MARAASKSSGDSKNLVVVTGGLSGIGAAAAQLLAAAGSCVVVLDRAASATSTAPADIEVYPLSVDISDETAVGEACAAIEDRNGPITGLVNAAGILGKMHRRTGLRWQTGIEKLRSISGAHS